MLAKFRYKQHAMKTARRDQVVPLSSRRRLPMALCLALFAGLLIHANASAGRGNPATQTEFECVIEPQQIVKLANPVVGVIAQLDVDRGDLVHKGQIVGKLEDGVEAATLALARVRATNESPVKSAEARLQFLRRKHERANELHTKEIGTLAAERRKLGLRCSCRSPLAQIAVHSLLPGSAPSRGPGTHICVLAV